MAEVAIETQNLGKIFPGGVQALKSLDLKIRSGESVGYLGPNGAGKTTTIQILLNLLRPTKGEVYIFGEQMQGQERKILRRIGALVELPGFYDYLTPDQTLKHICRIYRMNQHVTEQQIKKVLEQVHLSEVRHRAVGTFSTGMRRRLGIAQVLVHDPDLIIFDEPTSGLDPKGVRQIRDLIKDLNIEGKTVFMSSHNLAEVTEISDRVIFLNKGTVVEDQYMTALQDRLSSNQIDIKISRVLSEKEKHLLESFEGIVNVRYNKNITVEFAGDQQSTEGILQKIVEHHLPIYSFTPRAMTLEDLYLQLFGKEDV